MSQCYKVPKNFGNFNLNKDSESQNKQHAQFFQPANISENDLSNNMNSNRLQYPISGNYSNFLNHNSYNALENILRLENGYQLGGEGYSNFDYDYKQKNQQQQQQQQQYFNLLTTNFNSNLNVAEEVSNNLFEQKKINQNQVDIVQTNSKEPIFKDQIPKQDKILSEIKKLEQIDIPCQKDAFSLEHMRLLSKKTLNNKELYQQIIPLLGILEEEPRYVNSRQYHRMMIMRIKRAKKAMTLQKFSKDKQNQQQQQQQLQNATDQLLKNNNNIDDLDYSNSEAARTYKYESRHKHAMNRQRGPDGRFKPQNKQNMTNKQSKRIMKQNSSQQLNNNQQKVLVKEEVT